ncbi:MAG: O-antigen ligase family protein [Candidatus Omnitrophota bacterium]
MSKSLGSLFFKTMEYLLLFFIMAETINTRKKVRNILIVIFVSAFITGIDGIYQQITGFDFFRKFPLLGSQMSATFKFSTGFGTYLATVLPLPIAFIASKATNKKSKFILIGLCLILLIDLVFAQSRGAWLGFVTGVLFVCLISGRKNFIIAVTLLIMSGIILSFFAPGAIKEQMKSFLKFGSDASTNEHLIIWKTGWKMFIDKPVFGHGLNTFMRVFSDFRPKGCNWIMYAHNCFLQMAAEIGIIGLLAFLWLTFVILWEAMLKFFTLKEGFLRAASLGLIGGLLAYLVHSLFDTNLYSLPLAVMFWSVAGLAAAKFQIDEL